MTVTEDYRFYELTACNIKNLFTHFFEINNPQVFSAIATLTGLSEEKEVEKLAVKVWIDCWAHRNELLNEARPGVFIYRILLQHVFLYLKKGGNENRICALRNILHISPTHYSHILEPAKAERRSTVTLIPQKENNLQENSL